jgi:hypothetical protein
LHERTIAILKKIVGFCIGSKEETAILRSAKQFFEGAVNFQKSGNGGAVTDIGRNGS